jgi:hypothetical protein
MKLIQPNHTIAALAVLMTIANPSATCKDSSVLGIFAGNTLCGDIIRPLHKISLQADCELVEWKLTLYQDPLTRKPTTYKLISVSRFIVKQTNMYSQPGIKTETEGKWTNVRGRKSNPHAIVYQMDPGKPEISIRFLKLSDDLLHLLDQDGGLMIGSSLASYTLNRVSN